MDIKVLKKEDNFLEAEVDADIGLLKLIKDYLLENRSVEFAAVVRDHPFYKPRLIIRTKGKTTPAEALDKSIEKILSMTSAFAKHLK
ncbi:hypothetical protein J7K41_02010 [Candidatus Micrarchaeota archaeon]|nr:hypothetical protein [Candidatus Micrarchaeota archaeon]